MNMNNADMSKEDEIDLLKLFRALWKKIWVIALAAIIGGGAMFAYTKLLVTPLYKSSAMMYVNNSDFSVGSTKVSLSDLNAAQSLVDTYAVILKSRGTLEKVIDEAQLPYTYEELNKMVETGAVNNTEIFSITVTSADPEEATKIANTIVDVLPNRISEIMDGSDVRTVDFAVVPSVKSSPSTTKNMMLGIIAGFVSACAVIIVIELMDTKIHSEDYLLTEYPDIPLLAVIPDMNKKPGKHSYYYYENK